MWQNLVVLHRTPPLLDDYLNMNTTDEFISWHTCQRSIWVGDIRVSSLTVSSLYSGMEIRTGYNAYRFLLEVVSGIQSKLFGESEIQSQFIDRFSRQNLSDNNRLSSYCIKLRDDILEHSRRIRSQFFTGQGRQTYGGIADSILPSSVSVAVIGTGNLAESIMTHLIKKGRNVLVLGRNQSRLEYLSFRFPIRTESNLDKLPRDHHLVIAAPIDNELFCNRLDSSLSIVDFRGETYWKNPRRDLNYIPFHDILAMIESTNNRKVRMRSEINSVLDSLVTEREEGQVHMPHGWEDLICHI